MRFSTNQNNSQLLFIRYQWSHVPLAIKQTHSPFHLRLLQSKKALAFSRLVGGVKKETKTTLDTETDLFDGSMRTKNNSLAWNLNIFARLLSTSVCEAWSDTSKRQYYDESEILRTELYWQNLAGIEICINTQDCVKFSGFRWRIFRWINEFSSTRDTNGRYHVIPLRNIFFSSFRYDDYLVES